MNLNPSPNPEACGIKVTVYCHPPACVFDTRMKFSLFEFFHNITYSIYIKLRYIFGMFRFKTRPPQGIATICFDAFEFAILKYFVD